MAIRSDGVEKVNTVRQSEPVRATTSQNLSSGALSFTTSFNEKVKILSVMAHFTADPKKNDFVVTFNSLDGANYDTVLRKTDVKDVFDVYFEFDGGSLFLDEGDELTITCSNDNSPTATVYVTVIGETA